MLQVLTARPEDSDVLAKSLRAKEAQDEVLAHQARLRRDPNDYKSRTGLAVKHLEAGQVVGRAGRSGRATGTHLHFEVIANGKQVDPLKWAQKWAETAHVPAQSEALKHTGVVADLAVSRSTDLQETTGHVHED